MIYSPKVSIIIPVYNGSNYVSEAIDSALNQTYKNIEIIVVNDGSNDNGKTREIVLSYGDKVNYFEKENGGVATALNLAITKMTGDWFSWLSHDDLYKPEKIEKQIEFIRSIYIKTKIDHEDITVYGANENINHSGKVVKKKIYRLKPIMNNLDIIMYNINKFSIGGCSVLVSKKTIKEIGYFNEDLITVQDADYWFRILLSNKRMFFLKDRLVQNRVHKSQVGKKHQNLFYKEQQNQQIWLVNQLKKNSSMTTNKYLKIAMYQIKRNFKESYKVALNQADKVGNLVLNRIYVAVFYPYYYIKGKMFSLLKFIYRRIVVREIK